MTQGQKGPWEQETSMPKVAGIKGGLCVGRRQRLGELGMWLLGDSDNSDPGSGYRAGDAYLGRKRFSFWVRNQNRF